MVLLHDSVGFRVGVPLPPGGVGYFAGKSFVLMGLSVGCGCKIQMLKGLRLKYCIQAGYGRVPRVRGLNMDLLLLLLF